MPVSGSNDVGDGNHHPGINPITAQHSAVAASTAARSHAARSPAASPDVDLDDVSRFGRINLAASKEQFTPDVNLDDILPNAPPPGSTTSKELGNRRLGASLSSGKLPRRGLTPEGAGAIGSSYESTIDEDAVLAALQNINSSSWQQCAQAAFPNVLNLDWHDSLHEFMFDLWPVVAKGHDRLDQVLLTRAYLFLEMCVRSSEPEVALVASLTFAEAVGDYESLSAYAWEHLPASMLQSVLLPCLRWLYDEELYQDLLENVREMHPKLQPAKSLPQALASKLVKLGQLRYLHPAVSPSVLAYIEGEYQACWDGEN